jgi:hypothetical protein
MQELGEAHVTLFRKLSSASAGLGVKLSAHAAPSHDPANVSSRPDAVSPSPTATHTVDAHATP